jgi:hypothetical protein
MNVRREVLIFVAITLVMLGLAAFLGCSSGGGCTQTDSSGPLTLHEQGNTDTTQNLIWIAPDSTEPHLQISHLNVGFMHDHGCYDPPTYDLDIAQLAADGTNHMWLPIDIASIPGERAATLEGGLTIAGDTATYDLLPDALTSDLTAAEITATFPLSVAQAALNKVYSSKGLRTDWQTLPSSEIIIVPVQWTVDLTYKGQPYHNQFTQQMATSPLP